MIFDERTYSVLVVSASEKFNGLLQSVMPRGIYSPFIITESTTIAKRKLLEQSFDLVIINTPLPDEFGVHFAVDACRSRQTVCMLIVKDDIFEDIHSRVNRQGVFVLSKPLNATILARSVKWLESARERLRAVDVKIPSVEEKMEEIRLVNRAKWILIEHKNMTEDEAHHFIEKKAMDNGMTRRAAAEEIIASAG